MIGNILVYGGDTNTTKNVDLVIYNTTIIDVINKQILTNKNIIIIDGKISNIQDSFPEQDILNNTNELIDGTNCIALPGFVNTHTHLWQHISKSLAPKEPLQTWIRIYRPIHYLTEDEFFDVILAASCEALLSGITTVSDYISSFNDYIFETTAKSVLEAGLNGVLVLENLSMFLHDQIKLREIERLRIQYKDKSYIWMGFGPLSFHSIPAVYSSILLAKQLNISTTEHTMENIQEQRDFYRTTVGYLANHTLPNSTDEKTLRDLVRLAAPSDVDAYEQLLRTAEQILKFDSILQNDTSYKKLTEAEKNSLTLFQRMYSRRISLLILLDYFEILKDHLAIHSVWLENEDIDILIRNNMSISHNPESNMYLTSGIAPVDTYLRKDVLITLGTDGAASNDGMNFFSAMREMWNVYKIKLMNTEISKTFDEWNIIQAATINGAKALKIDDKIGSIDIGKQADISLIATDELGVSPLRPNTTIALLIYSANARNVKHVISNGTVRVENGVLKQQNQTKLAERLSQIAQDVALRMFTGKNWSENYMITKEDLADSYWYKYQSIRPNDTVSLTIRSDGHIGICIASSGAVFGGGTATVMNPVARERFPEDILPYAFSKLVYLDSGIPLTVTKAAYEDQYKISMGSSIIFNGTSLGSTQLLILVTPIGSQFTNVCINTTSATSSAASRKILLFDNFFAFFLSVLFFQFFSAYL